MCILAIYYRGSPLAHARALLHEQQNSLLAFPSVAGAWNISGMSKVVNPLIRAKITAQDFPRDVRESSRGIRMNENARSGQ